MYWLILIFGAIIQDDTGLLHTRYRALHYLKPELKKKYMRAEFIAERFGGVVLGNITLCSSKSFL
jgi:hypothetical protein